MTHNASRKVPGIFFALLLAVMQIGDATEAELAAFEPPPDEFDWVQLTSDEWLKGELIAYYEDTLEFDSDNLGVLKIDWEDVKRIRTHAARGIIIEEATAPLLGVVEVTKERVVIRTDDAEKLVDRDRIVSIAPSEGPELSLWRGRVSFGANIRKGNSDIVEYNAQAVSRRLTAKSRIIMDYIGNFNETEGVEVANRHRFTHSYDRFKDTRTFWRPVFGQYFRDTFQNIKHQASLGGGYGWHVVDRSKATWDVSVSAGGQYVWYVSALPGLDEQEFSPAAGVATEYDTELTDWLDYFFTYNMFFLNDSSGRFKHHLVSEVSTDIWGDLDFKVGFVWDRTERPQARADGTVPDQDDFRLIVGLEWDF